MDTFPTDIKNIIYEYYDSNEHYEKFKESLGEIKRNHTKNYKLLKRIEELEYDRYYYDLQGICAEFHNIYPYLMNHSEGDWVSRWAMYKMLFLDGRSDILRFPYY